VLAAPVTDSNRSPHIDHCGCIFNRFGRQITNEMPQITQWDSEGGDFFRSGNRPAPPLICGFIDQVRARGFRAESICRVVSEQGVQVASRTYRNSKTAKPVGAHHHRCSDHMRCGPPSAPQRPDMDAGR
jgi:hypothetical protein